MCLTAVANLASQNPERKFFSKDRVSAASLAHVSAKMIARLFVPSGNHSIPGCQLGIPDDHATSCEVDVAHDHCQDHGECAKSFSRSQLLNSASFQIKDTGIFTCQDDPNDQAFGLVNQVSPELPEPQGPWAASVVDPSSGFDENRPQL